MGGTVVLNLLSKIDEQTSGYKVFFDNFFTSFHLMSILVENGVSASGIVRANRLYNCPLPKKEVACKKIRGTIEFRNNKDFSVTQWTDNNVVYLASKFDCNQGESSVSRYSQ